MKPMLLHAFHQISHIYVLMLTYFTIFTYIVNQSFTILIYIFCYSV